MTTNLEKLQREKQRRLADIGRTHFASFVKAGWSISDPHIPLSWSWHHDAICEHMQAMVDGHITRLAVALPPRHTKSTIISLAFNAWLWINHPGERLLTASYALDLAIRDAERSRALMESEWYRTYYGSSFEFSSSQNVKSWYRNSQGGTRIATSVSGAATGEGGSFCLCLFPDTQIETESGRIKISDIVEHTLPVRIASYNHDTQTKEYKSIEAYEKNSGSASVRVTCSNGAVIECTTNHPFYSNGRYVDASKLQQGDAVYASAMQRVRYPVRQKAEQGEERTDVEIAYVVAVETIAIPEYVYNIRIADNHNYFANGVLTHNCDDPINVMEANSELERLRVNQWWDGVMGNRLNDQQTGRMIIVSQRTHKYDLIGHVLEQGGYEYLCLPAEYEAKRKTFTSIGWSDPRTVEGQPLWPEKFPVSVLAERKRIMRLQYYSQYQQDPQNEEGSIIKPQHLQSYRVLYPDLATAHEDQTYLLAYNGTETVVPAHFTRLVISTDYAVSKLQKADYSVFLLWAVTSDFNFLLLDAIVEQVTGPEAEEDAAKWCRTYQKRLWAILVEDVAYQKSIIQRLQQEGIPVIPKHPQGDKVARAQSIAVYFRNGQFYFPEVGFPLLADIIKNIVEFPGTQHDDIMDAVSILLALVQGFKPRMRDLESTQRVLTPEEVAVLDYKRTLRTENRELYKFLYASDDRDTDTTTIGRY